VQVNAVEHGRGVQYNNGLGAGCRRGESERKEEASHTAVYIGRVPTIDLNADLGEGSAHDAELLALVSSANIACGFHAGDPMVMRETVATATRHGVVIGVHPGYPDLNGFGRVETGATPDQITAYVIYQIGALDAICRAAGTHVRYVKPHGALYNRAASDPAAAAAIARAIHLVAPSLVLLGLADSALISAGRATGLRTANEAFLDRAYRPDGTLVPRDQPGAVLTDPDTVIARAVEMATDGRADSLCLHGDTPGAPALLRTVRRALDAHGVTIAPFAR
jgi:5-oxoprolinase (ATP-hydrolysing) subunit A